MGPRVWGFQGLKFRVGGGCGKGFRVWGFDV